MDWSAAIEQAAAAAPLPTIRPKVPGRVIHGDGDYLAYFCSGDDDTDPGRARRMLLDKLDKARDVAGASSIILHLTSSSSTKGDRRLISTVFPYQGKRGGKHPKNWQFLRDFMESYTGAAFTPKVWGTREADDGAGFACERSELGLAVPWSRDKDWRIFSGLHLCWDTDELIEVPHGAYDVVGPNGLQYGHKWFWLQMLQGDDVDNVPGLPKYMGRPCGPKTAETILKGTTCNEEAFEKVAVAYFQYYQDEWPVQLAEQAALLWMRTDAEASPTGFMQVMPDRPDILRVMSIAAGKIRKRITDAYEEIKRYDSNYRNTAPETPG